MIAATATGLSGGVVLLSIAGSVLALVLVLAAVEISTRRDERAERDEFTEVERFARAVAAAVVEEAEAEREARRARSAFRAVDDQDALARLRLAREAAGVYTPRPGRDGAA